MKRQIGLKTTNYIRKCYEYWWINHWWS